MSRVFICNFPLEIGIVGVMRTVRVEKCLREADWQPVEVNVSLNGR